MHDGCSPREDRCGPGPSLQYPPRQGRVSATLLEKRSAVTAPWFGRTSRLPASLLIKADWTFERPRALVRDPNPSDLERSAAGYHDFALRRCETVIHQVKQFGREPRKEHWISTAVLSSIGEHLECKAGSAAHYYPLIQNVAGYDCCVLFGRFDQHAAVLRTE